MRAESLFTYATLFGFLFTLARVSCVFAFLPLGAFRAGPDSAKIVLALGFTLLLWPEWAGPASGNLRVGELVVGVAGEAAMGLAIGLAVAIVLEVFQVAAQIVSLQAGFGFASMIDPSSGADSTVLLTVAQLTAGLLFFATGADRLLVQALADTIKLAPPGTFVLKRSWGEAMIQFSSSIFGAGLRLGAPIVALLLLADASLAILGRVQAQIHLISLTMPVKLGVSLALMASTLALQPRFFNAAMAQCIRLIESVARSAH